MKAAVLRAPGELGFDEVARPVPDQNQILVRVTNSGVCGTDLKIFDGSIQVRHPLIMGHEMSGTVVEGGDGERISNGGRVIVDPVLSCGDCFHCQSGRNHLCPSGTLLGRDGDGGFAEYVVAPRSQVFPLPDDIENSIAPFIQVLTTCVHAQRRVNVVAGQSVVVLGLGATGQIHLQLAKSAGASPVIGVARSAWKRQLAEKLGADLTLPAGDEAVRGVLQATNGRGADLVIDSTGMIPVIANAIEMARPGGTVLLFGITTAAQSNLPFYQLYFKELTLISSRAATNEDFPTSIELVRRGAVQLKPLVSHVLPLRDLATAIGMLRSDDDRRMKIILDHA